MSTASVTPLMKQYFEIKDSYPNFLLFFQVGDFYELFFDDAKVAASFLGITLTKRGMHKGEPIPLCGVPRQTADHYLVKLVKGGFNVAICDQLEPPSAGKVVKRGVTRVLTPGTLTDPKLLDEKSASYLFSFYPSENSWGLIFGELLTAQLFATVVPHDAFKVLEAELARFFPDEILLPSNYSKHFLSYFKKLGYVSTLVDLKQGDSEGAEEWLSKNLESDLSTINNFSSLKSAISNFYSYMNRNQTESLPHFNKVHFYKPDDFLILDSSTQRNLELVKNLRDGSRKNTLLEVLDKANTSMGSRMIKKWLVRPLIKKEAIIQRQDAVENLVKDQVLLEKLREQFSELADLERIIGRISLNRAMLLDYVSLSESLTVLPRLKNILKLREGLLGNIGSKIGEFASLSSLLKLSINTDFTQDKTIKDGFNEQLDKLRGLVNQASNKILDLEKREQARTGIASLKIRYNQVQGYYIEVTKPNMHLVPQDYMRMQTLSGKERYMTSELKQLQIDIETARNSINKVESEVFDSVKKEVYVFVSDLRRTSNSLAHLDALLGFAKVAFDNGYVRPELTDNRDILIEDGVHPVVQQTIGEKFIPNSTNLTDAESLWIITGPNMGGKSTYLRQVALLCLMAQCGSFIPAKAAKLPILDRIFTRIGAGDNLAEGKSTFLVEMEETALICNLATEKSLVILDEVGRGTSTFDGMAIAQSVIEYIYSHVKARCLFATHYHELTELKDKLSNISVYHAASKRTQDGVLLLHKIVKGVSDGSFGLEVAKLANLPEEVVFRAAQILEGFSKQQHITIKPAEKVVKEKSKIEQALLSKDLNNLTPKEAFDFLWNLKSQLS